MKCLNLYSGLGGNRLKWSGVEVTAVESDPKIADVYKAQFPDDCLIIGDAHDYLLENFESFDFIWSSPPCQSHSRMMKATRHKSKRYPDLKLYEEILLLREHYKGHWVVENVVPYYEPLIKGKKMGRHMVWSNFDFDHFDIRRPQGLINKCNTNDKRELQEWLGIRYEGNIYYGNNHDPSQVLRNCVHPDFGLHIFSALKSCLSKDRA